uniref:Uncharacterized protein n=1 Tax=Salix viminalis TaxID=40686 RepID=A0A6N2MEJ3_SALVM
MERCLMGITCNTICLRHQYDNYKQGIAGPSYRIPGQNQLNWMVSTTWPDYTLKDLDQNPNLH